MRGALRENTDRKGERKCICLSVTITNSKPFSIHYNRNCFLFMQAEIYVEQGQRHALMVNDAYTL